MDLRPTKPDSAFRLKILNFPYELIIISVANKYLADAHLQKKRILTQGMQFITNQLYMFSFALNAQHSLALCAKHKEEGSLKKDFQKMDLNLSRFCLL